MKAECGVYLQLDLRWKKHAQQAQKLQEQPGTTGQGCLALQIETRLLSTTIKDPGLQRCMAPWSSFRCRCHAEKHHSCRSPRRKECRAPLLSRALYGSDRIWDCLAKLLQILFYSLPKLCLKKLEMFVSWIHRRSFTFLPGGAPTGRPWALIFIFYFFTWITNN